jgi:hypothetical protein
VHEKYRTNTAGAPVNDIAVFRVSNCDEKLQNSSSIFLSDNCRLPLSAGPFLGAFAKLRNATFICVMSVCPSGWNNSAPSGRILMKMCI